MRIFLVRHGKPEIIGGDFYRCHLGKQGIEETLRLAQSGAFPEPDAIFSSPYNRAIDTAKVFSEHYNVPFQVADFLKEWNLQSLNLQGDEYVREENLGWADQEKPVRGGESIKSAQDRIYSGVLSLATAGKSEKLLLVSHGTVIDLFCARVSGRSAEISDIKKMGHNAFAEAHFGPQGLRIVKDIISR